MELKTIIIGRNDEHFISQLIINFAQKHTQQIKYTEFRFLVNNILEL